MADRDPKTKCDSCGFTLDAHWGAHPICEPFCTGFVPPKTQLGYDHLKSLVSNLADDPYALTPDQWQSEARTALELASKTTGSVIRDVMSFRA